MTTIDIRSFPGETSFHKQLNFVDTISVLLDSDIVLDSIIYGEIDQKYTVDEIRKMGQGVTSKERSIRNKVESKFVTDRFNIMFTRTNGKNHHELTTINLVDEKTVREFVRSLV